MSAQLEAAARRPNRLRSHTIYHNRFEKSSYLQYFFCCTPEQKFQFILCCRLGFHIKHRIDVVDNPTDRLTVCCDIVALISKGICIFSVFFFRHIPPYLRISSGRISLYVCTFLDHSVLRILFHKLSLTIIYWENIFIIVLLDYKLKIHSLQTDSLRTDCKSERGSGSPVMKE